MKIKEYELKNIKQLIHSSDKATVQYGFMLDASLNQGKYKRELESRNSDLMSLKGLTITDLLLLQKLNCRGNQLRSLNISNLINLRVLWCWGNRLSTLDISSLINLERLDCTGNYLTSLDISSLINLRVLLCRSNCLKTLDVSNCKNLKVLICDENVKIIGLENIKLKEVIRR